MKLKAILFIVYSLSPGIAKLLNLPVFYALGLIIPLLLLVDFKNIFNFKKYKVSLILFLTLILIILFENIFLYSFDELNRETFIIGLFTFFIPLVIAGLSNSKKLDEFLNFVPLIAIVHLIIAFLIYPLSPTSNIPIIAHVASIFLEGAAAMRMASVSGSLAFSGLMTSALVITCYQKYRVPNLLMGIKENALIFIFGISAILTLQRSTWLGLLLIFIALLAQVRDNFVMKVFKLIAYLVVALIIFKVILNSNSDFNQLISDRFFSLIYSGGQDAISERYPQWITIMDNLLNRPLGWGIGQIGQAARNELDNISMGYLMPDNDYLRIISEFGILGIIFVSIIISRVYKSLNYFFLKKGVNTQTKGLALVYVCLSIQMIGSNVTEFYFINLVYWAIFFRLNLMIGNFSHGK